MTATPSLSVVVCTKDRPEELGACLASLAHQTAPPFELVVVDASAVTRHDAVADFRRAVPGTVVRHLVARPGLPHQRNLGARITRGDVVVFLDDDVVLEPGYLAAIAAVYADDVDGAIAGVGGAQVPDPTPREGRLRRFVTRAFLLGTYGRGIVKRSGRPEYLFSPRVPTDVEFLSGCNMSFRRHVVEALAFDERFDGYALGEDLRFSYRASRAGRLVLTPAARLAHRQRGDGRPVRDDYRAMAVVNRFLFFREQVARGPLDWLAYGWAAIGELLLVLPSPRERGLGGLVRGYARIAAHVVGARSTSAARLVLTAGGGRRAQRLTASDSRSRSR